MTVHGPLTSMALGRSPYDDVVMGEGEGDPRAPLQMYDERARPINPETRRINRDIIRSHNEVMQVIGVVEPEESKEEVVAERLRRIGHAQHDSRLGRRYYAQWRLWELGGVWGFGGIRQRIFLYKEYSHIPFWQPLQYGSQRPWAARLFLDGLPAALAATVLDLPVFMLRTRKSTLLRWACSYVKITLNVWLLLRRTDLLPAPASYFFPNWRFFVPFTESSAIPPCPLPVTLSLRSVTSWLGSVVLGIAPILAVWSVENLIRSLRDALHEEIYDALPHPTSPGQLAPSNHEFILQHALANTEDPVQSQAQPGTVPHAHTAEAVPVRVPSGVPVEHAQGDGISLEGAQPNEAFANTHADPDAIPAEGSTTPPNGPSGNVRRPSTHPQPPRNTEPDDFTDDDEETEVVSATLISFDVENNPENPDPNDSNIPPGVWSAELRPNPGNDFQSVGAGRDGDSPRRPPRIYRTNELTQLPANLAARMFSRRIVSLCFAPLEASALREVALLWCRTRGLSTTSLWEPAWLWPFTFTRGGRLFGFGFDILAGFSTGTLANLFGVEVLNLLLDFTFWAAISLYSSKFVMSSSEWDDQEKAKQQRKQQQEQLEAAAAAGASNSQADLRTGPDAASRGSNRQGNGPTH
ncbi:hypothetical protein SLS53_000111 [Cytospora paraplurivora]|uniref:Uncharacterized protein n=1 Tax=Cytospora paraplurivora TaxID=2898453 RepID=A0AAN9UK69_9PEZI